MDELRRCAVEKVKATPDLKDVYFSTIDTLQEHFRKFQQTGNYGIIVSWLISVGEQPAELLSVYDPMMLLIFVHYGVLYLHVHKRWGAHDFGRRVITELSDCLHGKDPSWYVWTKWSREQAARFEDITFMT